MDHSGASDGNTGDVSLSSNTVFADAYYFLNSWAPQSFGNASVVSLVWLKALAEQSTFVEHGGVEDIQRIFFPRTIGSQHTNEWFQTEHVI